QRVNFAKSTIDEYEKELVHPALPLSVRAYDADGREIKAYLLQAQKDHFMYLQDDTAPEVYKVNRCKVALLMPQCRYGVSAITLIPERTRQPEIIELCEQIENEYYCIGSDKNGAFSVLDKHTGKTYTGVGKLIDKADAGDEYTYAWPENDCVYTPDVQNLTYCAQAIPQGKQTLVLQGIFSLPEALTADRKTRSEVMTDCSVRVEAILYPGIPYIDFNVVFDNHAKDHILQMEIPAGVLTQKTWASTAFSITEHDTDVIVPKEWMEYPFSTQPTHGFIATENESAGVGVACDGIMEYEAVKNQQTSLRITLLRCVGWLSRVDLKTRVGNGGWELETPKGQCLGLQTFHMSAIYYRGSWRQNNVVAWSERMLHPLYLQQAMLTEQTLAPARAAAFLSDLPTDVRLSAYKPSEDRMGVVLRVYSIAAEKRQVTLEFCAKEVFTCNLAEEERKPANFKQNVLSFEIAPGQISTFYLLP
ncbi:MAG: glycoside hydrolase family 38 C-terminal domain-containing protein, partial [Ruthenibacterium sp.]